MVVIGQTFKAASSHATRERRRREGDSLLRQRNELMFVGNMGETPGFSVSVSLLDPLLAGRDEIPPEVARAFQRITAEEHHPRRSCGFDRDAIAGPEDQQPRALIALIRDLALAIDQI